MDDSNFPQPPISSAASPCVFQIFVLQFLQSKTMHMTKGCGSNHASASHVSVSSCLLLRNETSHPVMRTPKLFSNSGLPLQGFFAIPTASVLLCLHVGIQCFYWHGAIRTYLYNQQAVICFNFLKGKDREHRWGKKWILTLSKFLFFFSPKAMKKTFFQKNMGLNQQI